MNGKEPIYYVHSITFRKQLTQKLFYTRGLHKKQGGFERKTTEIEKKSSNFPLNFNENLFF